VSKKLFAVLSFVCILLLSLSAAAAQEEITLNILMEEVPDTDVVRQLVTQFEEAFPGYTIEIEAIPYDAMRDRLLTSFLAPESDFDVIILDNPWVVEFAGAGFVDPLDSYIEAAGEAYMFDDFVAPVREIGIVDETVYGIPFYNYALGLIARQDILEAAGAEIPATLEEFVALTASLTTDDMAGIAMQPQRGYKIFEEWKNWLFGAGGDLIDADGNVTINDEAALAALNLYIQAYNESAPENSLNWGFDESLNAVASGQAAMMMSYNWMLPTLNNPEGPAGDLAGNFRLYEVPGGKAVLGTWHWAIPANAANKDASWDFIQWISSPEIDTQRVILGGAPVRVSVMTNADVWEQGFGEDYYTTVLSILEDAEPLAVGQNAEQIIEIVGTQLSSAVAGEKTPEQALEDAAAEVLAVLEG
jgi:ABC-type glycerol-3-phosphate transport system substrate-binding protein